MRRVIVGVAVRRVARRGACRDAVSLRGAESGPEVRRHHRRERTTTRHGARSPSGLILDGASDAGASVPARASPTRWSSAASPVAPPVVRRRARQHASRHVTVQRHGRQHLHLGDDRGPRAARSTTPRPTPGASRSGRSRRRRLRLHVESDQGTGSRARLAGPRLVSRSAPRPSPRARATVPPSGARRARGRVGPLPRLARRLVGEPRRSPMKAIVSVVSAATSRWPIERESSIACSQ